MLQNHKRSFSAHTICEMQLRDASMRFCCTDSQRLHCGMAHTVQEHATRKNVLQSAHSGIDSLLCSIYTEVEEYSG